MNPETEKIIKEQLGKLPIEIRNLFTDPSLNDKIINIGRKNGIINIEQLGILNLETTLVMLGLVHPDEFPHELKTRLNIDDLKVDNIINDINNEILRGIREKLKEIYEKPEDDDIEETEENEIIESNQTTPVVTPSTPVKLDLPELEMPKSDNEVLKSAGIEIISARDASSNIASAGGEKLAPHIPGNVYNKAKEEIKFIGEKPKPVSAPISSIQNKQGEEKSKEEPHAIEEVHPLLVNKMSQPIKMPTTNTVYSLNTSKENLPDPAVAKTETPKVDPYRELPQ